MNRWNEKFEEERKRVLSLPRKMGKKGKGYEDQDGADEIVESENRLLHGKPMWHTWIHKELTTRASPCRCVTELIDHIIKESKAVYKGTDRESDFLIFHDALSQLYKDQGAQDYLKKEYPEFVGRWVGAVGTTNAGTVYANRPTGDGPELCRGLDSHGFADLEYAVSFSCSLASVYPVDGPRRQRWNQGDKDKRFSVMEQVWLQVAPTSDRIIEDIEHLPIVVEKIIEYEGALVPDEVIRSGRRALSDNDREKQPKKSRKRNPSKRDKIATQKGMIIHEDLVEANSRLLGNPDDDGDDELAWALGVYFGVAACA